MFSTFTEGIVIFVIVCTLLIAILIGFITAMIYRYQQKQNAYYKSLEELKVSHANEMLQSQLEIQEQTFENISREIHDNIGQKLTLAKLHLNTLDIQNTDKATIQLSDSILIISEAINDLSDISRSMSSEIILNNGIIKALEFEITQLKKSSLYRIDLSVTGNAIFLDSQRELVLFRIIQEALNNIMKHSLASNISTGLHYDEQFLSLTINDDGKGFASELISETGTGIANMKRRTGLLNGIFTIDSKPDCGTSINIKIPLYEN